MFTGLSKTAAVTFSTLIAFMSSVSFGHGKKLHETHHQKNEGNVEKPVFESETQVSDTLAAINQSYLQNVKPALMTSCGNCHSDKTIFPWYHVIPGIKEMIDQDISEARTHLDLSSDFPFTGHGSPTADLEAIQLSIVGGKMPPWSYRMMHSESKLSNDSKAAILSWVQESLALLKMLSEGKAGNE